MFSKNKVSPYIAVLIFLVLGLLIVRGALIRKQDQQQRQRFQRVREYRRLSLFRFPGDFESQQAIWMQWPSGVYNYGSHPVNPVMLRIIRKMAPYVRINLLAQSTDEIVAIRRYFSAHGFSGANVHFYPVRHLSIWARDVGPLFLKDGWGHLKVADFGFNNYGRGGNPAYFGNEAQVDRMVAQRLKLPLIRAGLISEGGAIESNGRGTLLLTEGVSLQRNPQLSKAQIETEYRRVLGVTKIIWLKKGLAEDDGITGGHINEFARFAAPDTILLGRILPQDRAVNQYSQESYRRLEENWRILQNATDQEGKPFRIIRVPMPPTLYGSLSYGGALTVRSYLNYAVADRAVFVQSYWRPGRTERLRATENAVFQMFRHIFPGRAVIAIDAEDINRWGGGLHCITQSMPARS